MKRQSDSILHIDLNRIIEGVPKTDQGNSVWVVFWWRNRPLGHIVLDAKQLPIDPSQLAKISLPIIQTTIEAYTLRSNENNLAELTFRCPDKKDLDDLANGVLLQKRLSWLEDLWNKTSLDTQKTESISLVIPTRNRPAALADCLDSVLGMTEKPNQILVIDNGSDQPDTRKVVENFENVDYVSESIPGASAARNTGVRRSSGSIIVFLDDDELVHPNWLSAIISCFHNPEVAIVTGLVLPAEIETEAQFQFEQRFSFIRGYCRKIFDYQYYLNKKWCGVPVWEIGGSGNLAIRRSVFEKLGGFDQRLGAGAAGCSEDSELFYNALANGYRCDYEPNAVVYHRHRNDIQSLETQCFNYMQGHVTALLIQFAKYRDIGNLIRLFGILPVVYLGYFIRAYAGDPGYSKDSLTTEIAGCLSGLRYYRACR